MSDPFEPKPEHKATFGLWTIGNPGGDAFGQPVRRKLSPLDIVRVLADVGAYGANLHDNDFADRCDPAERDRIAAAFKTALYETGIVVPMTPTMASFFGAYSREKANKLKAFAIDRVDPGNRGMQYERLDQLVFDLLMGVR